MNQRIKVLDTETGKINSLKKFEAHTLIEFNKTHLSFSEIVKRNLLSKSELEKLVVAGTLKESKYKNKRYIERVALYNFFGGKK